MSKYSFIFFILINFIFSSLSYSKIAMFKESQTSSEDSKDREKDKEKEKLDNKNKV